MQRALPRTELLESIADDLGQARSPTTPRPPTPKTAGYTSESDEESAPQEKTETDPHTTAEPVADGESSLSRDRTENPGGYKSRSG